MKKVLLLLVLLLYLSANGYAQSVRIGATGGFNLSFPSNYESATGYHVGVKGELNLSKALSGFYIDFGVMLSSQGWKSVWYYNEQDKQSLQWKGNPCFLNIPIHVGYKISLGHNASLFVHAGPYIGVGLFGKNKLVTETVEGNRATTTLADNVFSDKQVERFDWGLGGKVGVEFAKHIQIAFGYDWGMRNINTSSNFIDFKNRVFSVSCAYMF